MDDRLARDPTAIRAMFSEVAPRYDSLNRLLSLRQDVRWRRRLIGALAHAPAGPVLDLATGTGDVALAVRDRRVVGADFTLRMLELANRKAGRAGRQAAWILADALALPFARASFAAVTVAFGVRNFADLAGAFHEIATVLRPGGVLAVLELHRPRRKVVAGVSALWSRLVITPLGRLVSHDAGAYAYLPASVEAFPDRAGTATILEAQGYAMIESSDLSGGIAALSVARWEGE